MTESGLLTGLALGGGYVGSLVILFRWFASSRTSHALAIELGRPQANAGSVCRWRLILRFNGIAAITAALLFSEFKAFSFLAGSVVPGVHCVEGWPPVIRCTLDVAASTSVRGAAAAVLLGVSAMLVVTSWALKHSPYWPFAILVLGIVVFGAVADLVVGVDGPARPQLCFRLVTALALTAAVGFALGLLILQVESVAACMRGALAHMIGASVRILGALSMLTLWPSLPPASAVAMLIVLLVPGVATALAGTAALSLAAGDE